MLSPFSDVPHVSRVSSDPIVRLEDYTRSEEIDLLDEGIDRYLSISRRRGLELRFIQNPQRLNFKLEKSGPLLIKLHGLLTS